jgi:hypothetical protein
MSDKSMNVRIEAAVVGRGRRGQPLYKTNPFLNSITLEMTEKRLTVARGTKVVDDSGEEIAETTIAQIHLVDNDEFVKLYTRNMSAFFELTKPGNKMLGVLCRAIQKSAIGKDEVLLTYKESKEIYHELSNGDDLSESTFSRGIGNLIENEFIAESPRAPSIYYINPNLLFNGNRVRFITEFRKSESFKEAKRNYKERLEKSMQ